MKFNMNDEVRVTLTAYGAQVWNARYDGLDIAEKYRPAPVEPYKQIKTQLWCLMQVFGSGIHLGMTEVPFIHNELEILK